MKGPNLSAWALQHGQFVAFLLILSIAVGGWAYTHLGQAEDPSFTVKTMVVQAYWPGATAQETADQVTDRIEKKLEEIPELDFLSSYVRPGKTQIKVNLRDDTRPEDVRGVWDAVRRKVGDIRHTLPSELQGPFFNDEFGDTYGNLYALTGDGFDAEELRKAADRLRDGFLRVDDVAKVELVGTQSEKIFVEASTARLQALGVDPAAIAQALKQANAMVPTGTIETGHERVRIALDSGLDSVDAIAELGVRVGQGDNAALLRLGDIASVRRDFADPADPRMRFDGQPAIGVAVSMRKGGDVIRLGEQLSAEVTQLQASLPAGIDIHTVSDQPKVVEASVHEFKKSLLEAVLIVLAVSFLSLGLRTGFVVALSIPLVLALTFAAMYALGIDLQRISLGALIIALGLLVDDAIIAVEMMALKLEQGWDRFHAAIHAYTVTAFPMLTGTLITASGFLPVGFAKSGSGEYVGSLFQVVGLALMLSWLVAVLFTPWMGFHLLREKPGAGTPPVDAATHGHGEETPDHGLYRRFRHVVEFCLRHRRVVVAITLAAFVGSLLLFRTVPSQFFPTSDRPELVVDLWLPSDASQAASEAQVRALEARLANDPDIASVTAFIGQGAPRFYLPLDVQTPNANLGELLVITDDLEARERVRSRIFELLDREYPGVLGRVNRLENGPPVGYPLQYRVVGPGIDTNHVALRDAADRLAAVMRSAPQVRNVNVDWGERARTLHVDLDDDQMRQLGLARTDVAAALETDTSGRVLTSWRDGDRSLDVVARLKDDPRSQLDALRDTAIPLGGGRFVPLSQIARVSLDSEEGLIWRRDRTPTLTVRADVDGAEAPDIAARLQPDIDALAAALPAGYTIETGGTAESSRDARAAIGAVMPLTVIAVLVLLMIQLQDLKRMLMVLATAPLGMIGVSLTMAIFRIPFGFVASLGVIALAGMIIRNAVILIVQIEEDRAAGVASWDAVVGSAVRRMRPILLTALAAILAMIPLTGSVFWGPMAWAIMGGLTVATLLTLLFLPALYACVFPVTEPVPAAGNSIETAR